VSIDCGRAALAYSLVAHAMVKPEARLIELRPRKLRCPRRVLDAA
jgi:hypothetical protein